MSVLDGSEVKRLNCHNVMQLNIAGVAMPMNIPVRDVMQVNVQGNVMPMNITTPETLQVNIQGNVMKVDLCWPDLEARQVVHNGQPLLVDGEPVYVLVRD